ncbi:MAG: hypothetical protein AAF219_01505 [Myxococcota bacterium]
MIARLSLLAAFGLFTAVSIAVGGYFYSAWHEVDRRSRIVEHVEHTHAERGACAALEVIGQIEGAVSISLQAAIDGRRPDYARAILANPDSRELSVFLEADQEGLIDRGLCEEMRLAAEVGETHPVLAMLLFTRERFDPCDEADSIEAVLDGLSTHRSRVLRALFEEPVRLTCFEPSLSERVAIMTLNWLNETPKGLDETDVIEVASFLQRYAPQESAELGCRFDALRTVSRLGKTIGCGADMRGRVLERYRYASSLSKAAGSKRERSAELVLVGRDGGRCQVAPLEDVEAGLTTVACNALESVSDVQLAVLIENLRYGRVRADLIAGVLSYDGTVRKLKRSRREPALGSWFAYDLQGHLLGATQVVELDELAERHGERVPRFPLRSFCRREKAKHCYDVDWTKTVAPVEGEPTIFASRPLNVILDPLELPSEAESLLLRDSPLLAEDEETRYRFFRIGREGVLVVASAPGLLRVCWRESDDSIWDQATIRESRKQILAPISRLLAAMDIERDGRPELLLQTAHRALKAGQLRTISDEIVLLTPVSAQNRYEVLTRLTVHEY